MGHSHLTPWAETELQPKGFGVDHIKQNGFYGFRIPPSPMLDEPQGEAEVMSQMWLAMQCINHPATRDCLAKVGEHVQNPSNLRRR